mgnify:CR=1 FL=1
MITTITTIILHIPHFTSYLRVVDIIMLVAAFLGHAEARSGSDLLERADIQCYTLFDLRTGGI